MAKNINLEQENRDIEEIRKNVLKYAREQNFDEVSIRDIEECGIKLRLLQCEVLANEGTLTTVELTYILLTD